MIKMDFVTDEATARAANEMISSGLAVLKLRLKKLDEDFRAATCIDDPDEFRKAADKVRADMAQLSIDQTELDVNINRLESRIKQIKEQA